MYLNIYLPETIQKSGKMVSIQQLYEIYNDAAEFYHRQLINTEFNGPDENDVFSYVCSRVSTESVVSWKLGYASQGGLYNYLSPKYSQGLLIDSGLIQESEFRYDYFDFLRNRIVIDFMEGGSCTLYDYNGNWIAG